MIKFSTRKNPVKHLILLCLITLSSCQTGEEKATYTGKDFKGNEKTCAEMKPEACTEIFTEADSFALKCKDEGKKVIQCGCHDFICLDQ